MSRSGERTNRKGQPRKPSPPQPGRTDNICGTRPDGSLPPGVALRTQDALRTMPYQAHNGPWAPFVDAIEKTLAELSNESDHLASSLFWEAMAAGHPEFEKDRVYELLLEVRNRCRAVESTIGSVSFYFGAADGAKRADGLLDRLARRNVGVRMADALQEYSRAPEWAISSTARVQIGELFGSWPRHDRPIVLTENNWDILDLLRREYIKDLILETKCPPLDFLVMLVSWPNLKDARLDSTKRADAHRRAVDWHQRLLRKGDWYEDFARIRNCPYARKRVRSFGRLVRRLANFCMRAGLGPAEMTTAVNYERGKTSAFVQFIGAMVSEVPFSKAIPDRGWPKFSRRVEREMRGWTDHATGPFQITG